MYFSPGRDWAHLGKDFTNAIVTSITRARTFASRRHTADCGYRSRKRGNSVLRKGCFAPGTFVCHQSTACGVTTPAVDTTSEIKCRRCVAWSCRQTHLSLSMAGSCGIGQSLDILVPVACCHLAFKLFRGRQTSQLPLLAMTCVAGARWEAVAIASAPLWATDVSESRVYRVNTVAWQASRGHRCSATVMVVTCAHIGASEYRCFQDVVGCFSYFESDRCARSPQLHAYL